MGIILLLLAATGVYFGYQYSQKSKTEPTSRPSSIKPLASLSPSTTATKAAVRENPQQVAALGRLEPAGGVIDVGAMTGDRIGQMLVKVGDVVTERQELARLDSYTLRNAELASAKIALADARKRLPLEKSYGQALIQAAEAGVTQATIASRDRALLETKVQLAKAVLDVGRHDQQRLEAVGTNIASEQDRSHQRLKVRQAEAELSAAEAELAKADASVAAAKAQADAKLAEATAGVPRLEAALQIDLLQQNVGLAEERLKMSQVLSPSPGRILSILTRKGETIAQRPVLRLGDVSQMICTCEVYETQVWSIAVGQPATITSRALAKPLRGRVTFIGQIVAKNEVMSIDPTKSGDNRVVEVHIDIEEDADAARLVNLQVDVVIDTSAAPAKSESPVVTPEQAAKT